MPKKKLSTTNTPIISKKIMHDALVTSLNLVTKERDDLKAKVELVRTFSTKRDCPWPDTFHAGNYCEGCDAYREGVESVQKLLGNHNEY